MSETTEEVQNDPWITEDTQLDTSQGPKHLADMTPEQEQEQENRDLQPSMGELEPEIEAVPVVPVPEAIPEPLVFNYDDGSRAIVEKSSKGWKATLDSGTGAQPEIFYGATKEKMYERLMSAKIQATKKIREQNRTMKLGSNQPQIQEQQPVQEFRPRALTPDDINQLKLQLADNPELAFDNYFQKKTGRSLEELNRMAEEGKRARQELEADAVSREFVDTTSDYFAAPENYQAIVKWLSRYKLNKIANDGNFGQIIYELYDKNLWTLYTVTEAYEDLRDNGLLVLPPLTPEPAVQEEVEEERTTTPTPTRRPRPAAGLGLRQNEARGNRQVPETTLTPSNLEDLSDKQIEELMAQVRRMPKESIKASLEKSRQRS